MDPAQELELAVLARQKPMIQAIAQGGSPVQQFYNDTTVFVTGGSGFLGKQLIEKLLRACEIKKIFVLLRPRKGFTIQQRLASIFEDPLYDPLKEKKPYFASRIVPVEGDVEDIRLGLSDKDWTMLTDEVNVIFHVAATVKFTEPIKKATLVNVRGTREMLTLAKQCKNLICFNYTSTAFAHATMNRIDTDVEEKFYPSPVPPEVMIEMVENVEEARLDAITPGLTDGWPNTYTFTKALAEELIRTTAGNLPVSIVKPPVVVSTYLEPVPGWTDLKTCFSSPIGALLGSGLGLLHVIFLNPSTKLSYTPLDYVNNAIIAASWDAVNKKKNGDTEIPIYTVSSSASNKKWGFLFEVFKSEDIMKYSSPFAVWYCCIIETSNRWIYWLLTWLLHYIPGYIADFFTDLLKLRPKGLPTLISVYSRMYKLTLVYQYFTFNFWNFQDNNLKGMIDKMTPQDRAIFNCDVRTVDYREQVYVWCIGLRKYIIKDGLKDSAKGAHRQKYLFKYLNYSFIACYGYLIYVVLYLTYSLFASIVKMFY